jgi:hypothetical protein
LIIGIKSGPVCKVLVLMVAAVVVAVIFYFVNPLFD